MQTGMDSIDDVVVLSREEYNDLLNANIPKSHCEEDMRRIYDDDDFRAFSYKLDVVYNYVANQLDKFRIRADDSFVSIKEVARYLKIHERTIQRHMAEDRIPYTKVGYNVRFVIKDVKAAVSARVLKTTTQRLNDLIDNFTPIKDEGSNSTKN